MIFGAMIFVAVVVDEESRQEAYFSDSNGCSCVVEFPVILVL